MLRGSILLVFVSLVLVLTGCDRPGAQPPAPATERKASALAASTDDPAVKEQQRFQGEWASVAVGSDGMPNKSAPKITISFSGDKVTMDESGAGRGEGSYVLRPTKDPKEIDMTMPGDDGKKWVLRGVYEVTDNELRICMGRVGGAVDTATGKALNDPESKRPPRLDSKFGAILTLKREKK